MFIPSLCMSSNGLSKVFHAVAIGVFILININLTKYGNETDFLYKRLHVNNALQSTLTKNKKFCKNETKIGYA